MFQEPNISAMHNCNFTNGNSYTNNYSYVDGSKPAFDILHEKSAPGAFHESDERHDPPKCHENTRVAIRQNLMIQVVTAAASCLIWLYGAAGAGKSAIAQSFAEACLKEKLLIGSFFFFRTAPLRNNTQRLAASLAYQLAQSIASTRKHIEHYITMNPAIFSSSLKDQLDKLFIQPLRQACEEDPTLRGPKLIILDGLDECDTAEDQQSVKILRALESVLKNTPIPIVVLIASRPEIHISSTFKSLDRCASVQTFRFGLNDTDDIDGDICLYLNDKFDEIKQDHHFKNYVPENWPVLEDIESIVRKSSGQFIYAATIIRYVGHHQCKPHERLNMALNSGQRYASAVNNSPFKELDALYLQILSGLKDTATTLAILHLAFSVFWMLEYAQWPKTIAYRLGLGPGDVELHLSSLASLMKYEGEETPIRFFHVSLRDFLMDGQRSGSLYIKQPAVYTTISKAYLGHLLNPVSRPRFNSVFYDISFHLPLAKPDEELFILVSKFESEIPAFIKAFTLGNHFPDHQSHDWNDNGLDLWQLSFSNLLKRVYSLKDAIEGLTKSLTFWDRCLEAVYMIFFQELQEYLTDDATHDFLVLAAFSVDDHFPRLPFALSLGMSKTTWKICQNDISKLCPDNLWPWRETLRKFLLNPRPAGDFFVTSEQFTRVTLKCLKVVMDTRLSRNIKKKIWIYSTTEDKQLSHGEERYTQAIFSMIGLLRRAPKSKRLIKALKQPHCQLQWLAHYPEIVKMYQDAVAIYLKAYSSERRWTNIAKVLFRAPSLCG